MPFLSPLSERGRKRGRSCNIENFRQEQATAGRKLVTEETATKGQTTVGEVPSFKAAAVDITDEAAEEATGIID